MAWLHQAVLSLKVLWIRMWTLLLLLSVGTAALPGPSATEGSPVCPPSSFYIRETADGPVCLCKPLYLCTPRSKCTLQRDLATKGCFGKSLMSFPANCTDCDCRIFVRRGNPPERDVNQPAKCDELFPTFCGPHTIIAGADKCGTNAVAAYLEEYPGVMTKIAPKAMSIQCQEQGWGGEVNFPFYLNPVGGDTWKSVGRRYSQHFLNLDWTSAFQVDKSTSYFRQGSVAAEAIQKLLPRAKVIIILCDPAKRVWSRFNQYNKRQWPGTENCPMFGPSWDFTMLQQLRLLEKQGIDSSNFDMRNCNRALAVKKWLVPVAGAGRFRGVCRNICHALQGGVYTRLLGDWFDIIGDNLLVISNVELKETPQQVMTGLLEHMGLDLKRYKFNDLGLVHSVNNKGQDLLNVKTEESSEYFVEALELLRKFYIKETSKLRKRYKLRLF